MQQNKKTEEIKKNKSQKKDTPAQWFYRVLQGSLIGIGGILPGVSGGVLCLMFGLYHKLMDFMANPIKKFKEYILLFLPVGIGGIIGLVGFARLIDLLIKANEGIAYSIFIGMIFGMMPTLFRDAGKKGRGAIEWTTFGGSLLLLSALFITLFLLKEKGIDLNITPNIAWYLVSGLVWGLSVIVPGLSSSSILIFLGLYEPMMSEIGSLQLKAIIPVGVGIIVVVLLLSKAVKKLFDKFYGFVYHFILGAVIATTVAIIPEYLFSPGGILDVVLYVLFSAAGFIASLYLDKLGEKIRENAEKAEIVSDVSE